MISRVLACGHSAYEPCLAQLPNAFPDTVCCPACTQLVSYRNPSPLSQKTSTSSASPPSFSTTTILHFPILQICCGNAKRTRQFSYPFCGLVNSTCIGSDGFSQRTSNHDSRSNRCSVEKEEACFVKFGISIDKNESCSKFKYSYEVKVLRVLYGTQAEGRFQGSVSMLTDLIAGENGEEKVRCMTSWAMVGLGICEAVYNLHLQGLSIGCLGASCFGLDEFGHAYVDICETLIAGRRVGKMIAGKVAMSDHNLSASLENENMVECSFVSPEAMFELLKVEGVQGNSLQVFGF
nr:protein translocase subunit SECA2, chloroplastic isoform X2 [Ipomoea batatas]